jgi:dsDNA-specific endonuclease/ATPase MutS2
MTVALSVEWSGGAGSLINLSGTSIDLNVDSTGKLTYRVITGQNSDGKTFTVKTFLVFILVLF